MEIKYQFFLEEKMIVQKFIGLFSVKEYMEYLTQIMVKGPVKPDEIDKILIDLRDTIFDKPGDQDFNTDTMVNLRKNIHNKNIKRDDVIHVFWVDDKRPKQMFEMVAQKMNMSVFHVCQTKLAIKEYLQLPSHFNDIESIVNNLSGKF